MIVLHLFLGNLTWKNCDMTVALYVCFFWFKVQEWQALYRNYSLIRIYCDKLEMVSWSRATKWRFEFQLPVNQWHESLWQQAAEAHLALKLGEPRQDWKWHVWPQKRKSQIRDKVEEWVWWQHVKFWFCSMVHLALGMANQPNKAFRRGCNTTELCPN